MRNYTFSLDSLVFSLAFTLSRVYINLLSFNFYSISQRCLRLCCLLHSAAHLFQLRIRIDVPLCVCLMSACFIVYNSIESSNLSCSTFRFRLPFLSQPDKNFMQFQCGRNIIYHIDADELFVSHYDNFIAGNTMQGKERKYNHPTLSPHRQRGGQILLHHLLFSTSLSLPSLRSCVELLVKCLQLSCRLSL